MDIINSMNRYDTQYENDQNTLKLDIKTFLFLLQNMAYLIKDPILTNIRKSEDMKFLGACISNINETFSQNFQDIFVLHQTNKKRDGYFVEFGSTDGKTISNTILLEKFYGWKGILSEPNPCWHKNLHENRSCHISKKCVYSKSNEMIDFVNSNSPDLSGIKDFIDHSVLDGSNIVSVQTISLLDLLDEYDAPSKIDYLSIDTEGSEYHILESFFRENRKYDIDLLTVEHNFDNDNRMKILNLMEKNGYERKFSAFSRCDDFYVRIK